MTFLVEILTNSLVKSKQTLTPTLKRKFCLNYFTKRYTENIYGVYTNQILLRGNNLT